MYISSPVLRRSRRSCITDATSCPTSQVQDLELSRGLGIFAFAVDVGDSVAGSVRLTHASVPVWLTENAVDADSQGELVCCNSWRSQNKNFACEIVTKLVSGKAALSADTWRLADRQAYARVQ